MGKSCFIHNVASIPLTNTCVGTVYEGTNIMGVAQIKAGYNLLDIVASVAATSTNFVIDASGNQSPYGLPMNLTSSPTSTPSAATNDRILVWGGISFATFYFYTAADADTAFPAGAPHKTGFFSPAGVAMGAAAYPPVNQGFFIYHIGATINWTNSFSVN